MADVTPDYRLEIVKIKANIAALNSNLANYRREVLEHKSSQRLAIDNIVATKKALESQAATLASLIGAHGDVLEEEIDDLVG